MKDGLAANTVTAVATMSEPALLPRPDRHALVTLEETLRSARDAGDTRAPLAIVAACLAELGIQVPEQSGRDISLEHAREDWLARLRSARRTASTLNGYRVALDDLIAFLDRTSRRRSAFCEETIVAYFEDYRRRCQPAEATYYRRFTLLRRFFRWLARRSGVPDPFLDLEAPEKPQQAAAWLTAEEFAQLLQAAGSPERRHAGLGERDRLVLLALVTTGLRRAELLALNWDDLDLDSERPSLLVERGKGGRPRRQPLVPELARALAERRLALAPAGDEPVFCGLRGKRLTSTILATIVGRSAARAGLSKHVTPHTLRHTAATWLRQQTGDARLVAAYLGHADLSTVSRYAHVPDKDLHGAAAAIAAGGRLQEVLRSAGGTGQRSHRGSRRRFASDSECGPAHRMPRPGFVASHVRGGHGEGEPGDRDGKGDPRRELVCELRAEDQAHAQQRRYDAERDGNRDGDGRRRETRECARSDRKDGKPEDRGPLVSRARSMDNTGRSRVRFAPLAGPPLPGGPAR